MLNIINNLNIFFEDCYDEIGVREYSRLFNISAPTASKLLKNFEYEGLLKKKTYRGYLLFRANRENPILRDLSRIYWRLKLNDIFEKLRSEFHDPIIILFGSLSKLETKKDSDVDIAVISKISKKIDLNRYEKTLGREIQLFFFKSLDEISKELKLNIINGYKLEGDLK